MSLLLKNRYQVLQVLSEAGGFGQTFLAEDIDTPSRRRCVIKKLKPVADRDEFQFLQERFHREAAILERLGDSSNQIPKLYAYFVENQEFYLVQELINGLTLRQKIQREGTLGENTVKGLLWSLLNVLDYVHRQNIIHRDIKPDNIILRQRDNKPVLIDFGIVKEVLHIGIDGNPTSSVLAGGTPGYMASEQAAGRPVYASDIYSLGATAIYLLTGRNPQQMTNPATGDIAWRQFAPQVSSIFATVLNKAMELHARDRYKTAAEIQEDLQRVFRGESTIYAQKLQATTTQETIVRPVVPQLIQQPRKPNYALYFGGAAVVLGLLAIIGVTALLIGLNYQNRETAQTTNTQNVNATRDTNATTTQNTNLSNTNSTVSNLNSQSNLSNTMINANILTNINTVANVVTSPTPKTANDFSKYIGKQAYNIMSDTDIKTRLKTLMKRDYSIFSQNLSVCPPFTKKGNYLVASCCAPNSCGIEMSFVALDLSKNTLHCAIMSDSLSPNVEYFSENGVIPSVLKSAVAEVVDEQR